jgi:hypothetical protein
MNSNDAAIIVPPGTPDLATNDIRAIRPPIDLPNEWAWIWWTLLALALAGAFLVWWFHYRHKTAPIPQIPVVPPHVRAKQKLAEALPLIHDARQFCTLVSDTIRVYLEERFQFHAPDRTTEEFLLELQNSPDLAPDQKSSLGQFLESCDLVKFARLEPTETTLRELHDSAGRLGDETQYEPVEIPPPPTAEAKPAIHPANPET